MTDAQSGYRNRRGNGAGRSDQDIDQCRAEGDWLERDLQGVDDDGVVGDVQVIEGFQQFADVTVMLNHAVGVIIAGRAALALHRIAQMNKRAPVGESYPIEFECQFSQFLLIDCSLQRTINSSFCRSQGDNRCLLCG